MNRSAESFIIDDQEAGLFRVNRRAFTDLSHSQPALIPSTAVAFLVKSASALRTGARNCHRLACA